MKILIDNSPLETEQIPPTFPEFCEQIMQHLMPASRSIGTCELDGTIIHTLEQARILFGRCKVCRIASIPLYSALEALLDQKCEEGRALEQACEELVTQCLLAEPDEIISAWQAICEEIKAEIGFLPRLAGLMSQAQVTQIADKQLMDLGNIMRSLHAAFQKADTVDISDILELQLLPWLQQMTQVFVNCSDIAKKLNNIPPTP